MIEGLHQFQVVFSSRLLREMIHSSLSRWWSQSLFYLHPYLGKWSNLPNIFQMGWNHQLVKLQLVNITGFLVASSQLTTGSRFTQTKPCWWVLNMFWFSPRIFWDMIQFDEHIMFQRGWNHQLEKLVGFSFRDGWQYVYPLYSILCHYAFFSGMKSLGFCYRQFV